MAKMLRTLTGDHIEVIDTSTAAGKARLAVIDQGLRDGTMDTHAPPLWLKVKS